MSRQQGYTVKITGFLPAAKGDIDAQIAALNAIKGNDVNALLALCKGTKSETAMTSREVDAEGNPLPKKPRQPRAKKADKPAAKKAA